eukprot:8763953-Lingulodinium_polyedra.AAC.1
MKRNKRLCITIGCPMELAGHSICSLTEDVQSRAATDLDRRCAKQDCSFEGMQQAWTEDVQSGAATDLAMTANG